jgi:CHAD domain-containing protein
MAGSDSREIERKYDVDETTAIPELSTLRGVDRVEPPETVELEAVYFDTASLALATQRITLRRRTGGEDAGWHLKLPVSADERSEIHEPLGADPEHIPERLDRMVAVHVRGRELSPVVTLHTRRTIRRLRGRAGQLLATFCDDVVDAERVGDDPPSPSGREGPSRPERQSWREWELELSDADIRFLDAADVLFHTIGVSRSASPSKLVRALGDRAPRTPRPTPHPPGSAGEVLFAALGDYRRDLLRQDPPVRLGRPGAVHKMRVATSKLRFAPSTFRPLLDGDEVAALRTELGWLAHTLGSSRDLDVMSGRLESLLRTEPPELVVDPISTRISTQLAAESATEQAALRDALNSPRYFRLLDAVDALVFDPALADLAAAPARSVMIELVNRRIRALRRAMRAADSTTNRADRDTALHDVRKSAKKVRFAADLVSPIKPNRAKRLAAIARLVQRVLGEQHDSVVARQTLLRISTEAHLGGESTFSYGRLHATEQARSDEAEVRYAALADQIPRSFDDA